MDLFCGFFVCVCVELFQMFLPSSTVEKSRFSLWKFQVLQKDGWKSSVSKLRFTTTNLPIPQTHHGARSMATDQAHWQPCRHCEMPQEYSRHHCWSRIEICVTSPISLLCDGSYVLDALQQTLVISTLFYRGFTKICRYNLYIQMR